jgi:exodeoxyribonuclease V alpha subunit
VTTVDSSFAVDRADVRVALSSTGRLRQFNDAGVLSAADVHVARRLGAIGGETDEAVLLGAALAVRAPRVSHVCTDLAAVRSSATSDLEEQVDLASLPWPDVEDWVRRLAASPLVAAGDGAPSNRPLRLEGTRLYLDRYWREERRIAADLLDRCARPAANVDPPTLAAGLARLFPGDGPDLQRAAAAAAVESRFAVVAGGPGTGKTTTVARILALLDEQAAEAGRAPPRVALAAPTGKAAARLEEAVHTEAVAMPIGTATRDRLLALPASTLHRLLGWRPGVRSRFRHDRANRLPHDVVVVDETSMVSLSLMAKLVEAVRADARLVLVGDPDQLASVEAGAVLGDIVGPAGRHETVGPGGRDPPAGSALGQGIVVLRRVHRFGGAIAGLAAAIQRGDVDDAVSVLRAGPDDVEWIDADVGSGDVVGSLASVRARVVGAGRRIVDGARACDAAAALAGMQAMRVLCAHRRGPYGVSTWTGEVERWLARSIDGYGDGGPWYLGRPLLVTQNDYALRLYNGDTGVIVDGGGGRPVAVFDRGGTPLVVSPRRLAAADTVHAMTVHKSQGSQFDAVAVVLPPADSPILTRELLYTAITRARSHLIVVGTEDSLRAAIERPIARASGLAERLWGPFP